MLDRQRIWRCVYGRLSTTAIPLLLLFNLACPLALQAAPVAFELVAEFGSTGTAPGQFDSPGGVAIDSLGRIIVADSGNNRVQLCQRDGSCTTFGGPGSSAGQFSYPLDVALDDLDRIFVVDTDNDRMQVCSTMGACTVIGGLGSALGRFDAPLSVAVTPDGRMAVADQFNGRVQICTVHGACEAIGRMVTNPGNYQPGELGFTLGVAADRSGHILVTDHAGGDTPARLQLHNGEHFVEIRDKSHSPAGFEYPSALAIDRFDRLYVRDQTGWNRCDHGGHCESLDLPAGQLAFTASNEIVVSDTQGNRVRIYRNTLPLQINPGLNDAWYNPATSGQGFFINVFPDAGIVFMAWFTYDLVRPDESVTAYLGEPGHRWITAQGPFADNRAELEVWVTSGGVFDAAVPAPGRVMEGKIILEFSGCNGGSVSYEFDSDEAPRGIVPIERIVLDNVPLCEALGG
jgi:DNA-binding beta-propeller fold protein YncE